MRALVRLIVPWFCFATTLAAAGEPPGFLRWHSYEEPDFPPRLLSTVVRDGFAAVMFTFDDHGRISDRVVIGASHPAFTSAVFEAMERWQVDTENLRSSVRREFVRFDFRRGGYLLAMGQRDANKTALSDFGDQAAVSLRTCGESAIDRPLREISQVNVEYPPQLKAQNVHGSATVSFLVDAQGRVRVPAVTDATDPEFGAAVLTAIRQWRFAAARQNGNLVQVLVERTFRFTARREKM